jgi:hypothetical protein
MDYLTNFSFKLKTVWTVLPCFTGRVSGRFQVSADTELCQL